MKVKFFPDTDTAHIEFSNHEVFETREINRDIFIDLDKDGNLVAVTIEHANSQADISEFSYQRISKSA